MGIGYLILVVAVAIIAYPLFERRMIERAKELAKKSGRRLKKGELPSYKLANRAYIIGILIVWTIIACVALITGSIFWIILASLGAAACIGYIIYWAYHGKDKALISALTYLICPFGAFVFCTFAKCISFPGGIFAGLLAFFVVAMLPRTAFLQGVCDRLEENE